MKLEEAIRLVNALGGSAAQRRSNLIRFTNSNCCELGLCGGAPNVVLLKRIGVLCG